MSIKRLSNNKYKIIVELGYDVLGNRRRKTETFTGTRNEATKREAELTSKYYHIGQANNISDLTFSEYSQIFLKRYCEDLSLTTKYNYEKTLKKIVPLIGKTKLNKITPLMLDKMYQTLKIGESGNTLGYHSMYVYYKVINAMFNQAIKWELLDRNPNLKANKPKKQKSNRNSYNESQVLKLLSCLEKENIKYKTLITLTLDSGARRSEICALRWSDVDFETNTISITKSLKVIKGVLDEETTKTENSKREVILSDSTIKILKDYKEWQDNYKNELGNKWINENRVFTDKFGNYMHPSTCGFVLRKIVLKYNLEPICFHELRHTCATLLNSAGIDPITIKERLGHSDISVTLGIYTHSLESKKRESASVFNKLQQQVCLS